MSMNDLKAEFSQAYVRAVAHAAGYFVNEPGRLMDGDGVDLTIFERGPGGVIRSPRLDLQLKATAVRPMEDPFPFDLEVKNYDQLRATNLQVPRILVVVVVPPTIDEWVSSTEERLLLRHCGYFKSLRGEPESSNTAKIRVRLDRSACFHVAELRQLMSGIRLGQQP